MPKHTTPLAPLNSSWLPLAALVSTTALIGYLSMGGFFGAGRSKFPVKGRLAVITGGSQGMGLEVAKQLAGKGASIAIVARNRDKLETALQQIEVKIWNFPLNFG